MLSPHIFKVGGGHISPFPEITFCTPDFLLPSVVVETSPRLFETLEYSSDVEEFKTGTLTVLWKLPHISVWVQYKYFGQSDVCHCSGPSLSKVSPRPFTSNI